MVSSSVWGSVKVVEVVEIVVEVELRRQSPQQACQSPSCLEPVAFSVVAVSQYRRVLSTEPCADAEGECEGRLEILVFCRGDSITY